MKRRELFALAGAAAGAPRMALAQKPMPRVGFLVTGDREPPWSLFKNAMAALGHIEGRTIAYELRTSDTDAARLERAAAELVGLNVDVLVAILSPAMVAARKATSTIPIVFFGAAPDIGGIDNVARPQGNLTGVFSPSSTLAGKGMQLFREIRPVRSFGAIVNSQDPFHVPLLRDIQAVATAEKIDLIPIRVDSRHALPAAFQSMLDKSVAGTLVQPSLGLEACAEIALKLRLPAISFGRKFADAGGLYSYGASGAEQQRLVAAGVDKVLKGAKPSSLPVQQSTRTELVVNQKTAKLLGITLPPMFLAQADEVIE
jgi:putative tryptophan/tyrosine transport system substrate-binding protein